MRIKEKVLYQLPSVLVFAITALVFSPALFGGYVAFDDVSYVSKNPYVLSGLSFGNLRWALDEHYGFRSPLLWISYMLDSALLAPQPWAFHLSNVLLHAFNAALLFSLLRRITCRPWLPLAAAALWALHPLRVESVAWVTERKDVLSAFFMFLSLYAYVSFVRGRSRAAYLTGLFFMIAGLMVKPVLVTLPVLMLLLDVWPLRTFSNDWKRRAVEKIPFFACAAFFSATGWIACRESISSLRIFSLTERAGIALHNYVFYLTKHFLPLGLSAPYPMTVPSVPAALAAFIFLTAVTLAALRSVRRAPHLFTGWFWFCIALAPVSGIIQVGNTTAADRFTYLPSIGLTVAVVWGIAFLRRIPFKKEAALIVAAGLILLTIRQIGFWRDSDALFRRALAVNKNNPVADAHYGGWLTEQNRLDEAGPHLLRAVELFPGYSPAVNNLGLFFFQRGDAERALICFETACANPSHTVQAEINLESCRDFIRQQNPAVAK